MLLKNYRLRNKISWGLVITFILIFISFLGFLYFNLARAISNEKFISISEKYGLKIKDVTDDLESDKVVNATVAYNKYGFFQIEFIEFTNTQNANDAFELNKTYFEDNDSTISTSLKDKKYKITYIVNTEDHYMSVIRKNNTLIYIKIPNKYKNEVLNFLKKIKY